jgi:hypothetical protein
MQEDVVVIASRAGASAPFGSRKSDEAAVTVDLLDQLTFSAFALFDYGFRLVVFAIGGLLFSAVSLNAALVAFPAMAAGLLVGNRVHGRISDMAAKRTVAALLVLGGVLLLFKAWAWSAGAANWPPYPAVAG